MTKQHVKIAVILPVKNEECGLAELLTTLVNQTHRVDEIILIDAGSVDSTLPIILDFATRYSNIKLIKSNGALPGKARNLGIMNSDADIIVHIDGGCEINTDWIKLLVNDLLQEKSDYITGNILLKKSIVRWFYFTHDVGIIIDSTMGWGVRSVNNMAGGAAIAYRRNLWQSIGGQPEWLRAGEDVLFAKKARVIGVKHSFSENAHCYWQAGPTIIDAYKKKIRNISTCMLIDKVPNHIRGIFIRSTVNAVIMLSGLICKPLLVPAFSWILILASIKTKKSLEKYRRSTSLKLPKFLQLPVLLCVNIGWIIAEITATFKAFFVWTQCTAERKTARQYLLPDFNKE